MRISKAVGAVGTVVVAGAGIWVPTAARAATPAPVISTTPGHTVLTQEPDPTVAPDLALTGTTGDDRNGWVTMTAQTAVYTNPATDPLWTNGQTTLEWNFTRQLGGIQVNLQFPGGVPTTTWIATEVLGVGGAQQVIESCPTAVSYAPAYGYAVSFPQSCIAVNGSTSFPWIAEFPGTTSAPPSSGNSPEPTLTEATVPSGYWLVARDGGVFSYGDATFLGSEGGTTLNAPIVSAAATKDRKGYWEVASDGGVFSFGDAGFYGSTGSLKLNQPIVAMAPTPDDHGYWLIARDGGVFSFGDAGYYGSLGGTKLNQPIVAGFSSPDGHGYTLIAADGGVFSFGNAVYAGSLGGTHLNAPVVSAFPTTTGTGYILVAADGGVFTFGDALFTGSQGGNQLNAPIVGAEPSAGGYRLTGSDGGVFNFDSDYNGSAGGTHLNQPVVTIIPAD